jgi:AAA15 family ATPase/GTPase
MFKNLRIKNFRIFEHIEFAKLSHVNLLAGRNNVGKTTLLEAILLFAKLGSPAVIINLLQERDLLISESLQKPFINIPVQHLFHNSQFPTGQSLYIGDVGGYDCIDIKRIFYKTERLPPTHDGERGNNFTYPQYLEKELGDEPTDEPTKVFDIPVMQKLKITYHVSTSPERPNGSSVTMPISFRFEVFDSRYFNEMMSSERTGTKIDTFAYPVKFVPTGVLSLDYLSEIWDNVILSGDKPEVIQMLKLIEPRAEDVNFIKSQFDNKRTAIVKFEGQREHLPLKNLGQGMLRMLQLVLSLVQAKNGFLLIDEFENGLHYSVQPKVWNMLFILAKKFNIQVFATTHSKDTVESFGKIWKQDQEAGSFHRLSLRKGLIQAVAYDCEMLDTAITGDIEVR